jgi:hypothetical protein
VPYGWHFDKGGIEKSPAISDEASSLYHRALFDADIPKKLAGDYTQDESPAVKWKDAFYKTCSMSGVSAVGPSSNGAVGEIAFTAPYTARITIEGVADLLFHAWNIESIAEKAASAKGSKAKKSDNVESYVYRVSDEDRRLGIPGVNFAATLIEAARYVQDPRSPRKSARDLTRAGVIITTQIAPFEPDAEDWDYLDRRRVTVQRAGITRERPAMKAGWRLSFDAMVAAPEYISPALLRQLTVNAGKLVGLCDFRPSYGRFDVVHFEILKD